MTRFASILLLIFLPLLSPAAEKPTALRALKELPEDAAKNLARIEARNGTPTPDQWHILVYNSEAEAGLKEYVVANGKLTTSREVSQFAESLTAADVIGVKSVTVDSAKVAQLAKEYASANKVTIATLSYQLSKQEAVPVWKVTCFNKEGEILGALVVSATKGTVLAHEGFATAPKSDKRTNAKLRLETEAQPMVAVADTDEVADEIEEPLADETVEAQRPEEKQFIEAENQFASSEKNSADLTSSRPRNSQRSRIKKSVERSRGGSSSRTTYRRSVRPPNPISAVRTVTSPVRFIVRRVLPF